METENDVTLPPVPAEPRRIKPGWYVLAALLLYSLIATFFLLRPKASVIGQGSTPQITASFAAEGLWFPVPGAKVPQDDRFLPTADRPYRKGINQGFVFNTDGTGIPIGYGTPVIAASDGTVMRADVDYQELSPTQWRSLLDKVGASGADESELDRLRGRQIWIRLEDGRLLRYGHLSNIKPDIEKGVQVYRGQVIGYIGNSGTDDGVSGTTGGARLQFEVWQTDNTFFGQTTESIDQIRSAANALFVGP
jgi:peptidoglycan LD-endopeptidase LytH